MFESWKKVGHIGNSIHLMNNYNFIDVIKYISPCIPQSVLLFTTTPQHTKICVSQLANSVSLWWKFSDVSSYKDTNPIRSGPHPMTSINFASLEALSPNRATLGDKGFKMWIWGGHKHSVSKRCLLSRRFFFPLRGKRENRELDCTLAKPRIAA